MTSTNNSNKQKIIKVKSTQREQVPNVFPVTLRASYSVTIPPLQSAHIETDLAVKLPDKTVGLVFVHHWRLLPAMSMVTPSHGNIGITITNRFSDSPILIEEGTVIAELVPYDYSAYKVNNVKEID